MLYKFKENMLMNKAVICDTYWNGDERVVSNKCLPYIYQGRNVRCVSITELIYNLHYYVVHHIQYHQLLPIYDIPVGGFVKMTTF